MKKLSFVSWFESRNATDEEKIKTPHYIVDGKVSESNGQYIRLNIPGTITLKECSEIYRKISREEIEIKKLTIDLSDYYEWNNDGTPVLPCEENPEARKGAKKEAKYYPAENCLRIYRNDRPIYENYDGKICNDEAVLTDSLC